MKILMVCLGNICRSPLAEGIMQAKIEEAGLDWEVDSAGTSSYHVGEKPDSRSIAIAQQYGVDINQQCSRQFQKSDLDDFDLIFAMDQSNYNNMRKMADAPAQEDKIQLVMNMADPGRNQAVPDPYYKDGFDGVYLMLERACAGIIKKYNSNC